jgi:LmbE family N-acetylglucosaminyl deacetylase
VAWVYLSPHLDDVSFSCGGLVWEQANAGEAVQVWTVCAADASPVPFSDYANSLHERWGTGLEAVTLRRAEDRLACRHLGAGYRHFLIPDAIYRRNPGDGNPLYTSDEELFGPLLAADNDLIEDLSLQLKKLLLPEGQLVCPLTLGNHVDHQLVRAAAERLDRQLWYYADLPYVLKVNRPPEDLVSGMEVFTFSISEGGMEAWAESAAAYGSQISTFWLGVEAMQAELRTYCRKYGGVRLWKRA